MLHRRDHRHHRGRRGVGHQNHPDEAHPSADDRAHPDAGHPDHPDVHRGRRDVRPDHPDGNQDRQDVHRGHPDERPDHQDGNQDHRGERRAQRGVPNRAAAEWDGPMLTTDVPKAAAESDGPKPTRGQRDEEAWEERQLRDVPAALADAERNHRAPRGAVQRQVFRDRGVRWR